MAQTENYVYRLRVEGSERAVKGFTERLREDGGELDVQHEESGEGRVLRTIKYSGPLSPEAAAEKLGDGVAVDVLPPVRS